MKALLSILSAMIIASSSMAQIRIDSAFAFGPDTAKKYSIYIPTSYSSSSPNAMMVGFHPYNPLRWNAESWCDTLLNFSEANDLILVCPDGDSLGLITDSLDYAFTTALMDSMKNWYNIDEERTYGIGFSMGGKALYEYGLSNAEKFGGFIPIGPAIIGSSFVSNVISNAAARPFYLVHGSADFPNQGFYPMITALRNNCAIVDSILMNGVGHTIDFPNRNGILTAAYKWVDSVNVTPRSASFSLNEPANLSSFSIKGFHKYVHHFKWGPSSLQDTCGTLKYEVMFDVPFGNFSAPLLKTLSDNSGLDTVLSLENDIIDSIMILFNVPLNGMLSLDWTVRSNINNRYSDTAKSFNITITRKKLGFDLISPSTNTIVTLTNGNNQYFSWEDLNHYITEKYEVMFDDTMGDFSNPIVSFLSTSNGTSPSLNKDHESLYYNLMFKDGKEIGDTVVVKWAVKAYDSVYTERSPQERIITFVRGDVGFKLFEPINNSIITSKKGTAYVFKWDSVLLGGIHYEWLFDTLGVDLSDSTSFTWGSDSDSLNARLRVDFNLLDSVMEYYNVNYLDTLHGQWTVRALHDAKSEYSLNTYNVTIIRAHPVGIDEGIALGEHKVFPNPANQYFTLLLKEGNWEKLELYTMNGKQVYREEILNRSSVNVDCSDLKEGSYLIKVIGDSVERSQVLIISR